MKNRLVATSCHPLKYVVNYARTACAATVVQQW